MREVGYVALGDAAYELVGERLRGADDRLGVRRRRTGRRDHRAAAGERTRAVAHAHDDPRRSNGSSSALLFLCAALSVLTTAGIIVVLAVETFAFLREVPIVEFLTGTEWTPLFANQRFGVLPLVAGTLLVSAIAMVVALPMGLLQRDLPERVRARPACAASSSRCSRSWPACRRSSTATSR